jgi:uncharacterized membrane protein
MAKNPKIHRVANHVYILLGIASTGNSVFKDQIVISGPNIMITATSAIIKTTLIKSLID